MRGRNFDDRWISYSEAVAASGIDNRALRNGLDRGALHVGHKLRIGRWVFSIRDIFELLVITVLARSAYIPVSRAGQVAKMLSPHLEELLKGFEENRRRDHYLPLQAVLLGFDEDFSLFLATDLNDVLSWENVGDRGEDQPVEPDQKLIGYSPIPPYALAKIVFSIDGPMSAVLMLCDRAAEDAGEAAQQVATLVSEPL